MSGACTGSVRQRPQPHRDLIPLRGNVSKSPADGVAACEFRRRTEFAFDVQ
ncbi:hypothetical protein ABIA39_001736 [Nocardia sp. GAS34]